MNAAIIFPSDQISCNTGPPVLGSLGPRSSGPWVPGPRVPGSSVYSIPNVWLVIFAGTNRFIRVSEIFAVLILAVGESVIRG